MWLCFNNTNVSSVSRKKDYDSLVGKHRRASTGVLLRLMNLQDHKIHAKTMLLQTTYCWYFIHEALLNQENCSPYHVSQLLFVGGGWYLQKPLVHSQQSIFSIGPGFGICTSHLEKNRGQKEGGTYQLMDILSRGICKGLGMRSIMPLSFLPDFLHKPLLESQPLSVLSLSGAVALHLSQGWVDSCEHYVEASPALQGHGQPPLVGHSSEEREVASCHMDCRIFFFTVFWAFSSVSDLISKKVNHSP